MKDYCFEEVYGKLYRKKEIEITEGMEEVASMLIAPGFAMPLPKDNGKKYLRITSLGERMVDSFNVKKHSLFGIVF